MVRSDEEEGTESSKSRELSKQIESHVVVLDDDQPRTATTAPNRGFRDTKNLAGPVIFQA